MACREKSERCSRRVCVVPWGRSPDAGGGAGGAEAGAQRAMCVSVGCALSNAQAAFGSASPLRWGREDVSGFASVFNRQSTAASVPTKVSLEPPAQRC